MGTAVAGAPDADPCRIDFGKCLEERNRVADILDLLVRHDAPFRAFAAAEAAIIETQYHITRIGEVLCVIRQDQAAYAAIAMAEDDARAFLSRFQIVGKVKVAKKLRALAEEMNVVYFHARSP